MNLVNLSLADMVGVFLGFVLTLFIFSYAWGDNPFFRIGANIFVGAAAGYAFIVSFNSIILPHLIDPLISGNRSETILAAIFLIPCAMILTKLSPRLSKIGNPALAILVGIGAAAAVGGAVVGTISPQVSASIRVFEKSNVINAGIILLGSLSTLAFFHFGSVRKSFRGIPIQQFMSVVRKTGQVFIAITFGVIFAGVYFAALTALIERISYLWTFLYALFGPLLAG